MGKIAFSKASIRCVFVCGSAAFSAQYQSRTEPSHKWYMVGNVSLAPNIFKQLYVIRVSPDNSAVSTVYGLLPNKQRSYEAFIKATVDRCVSRSISRVQPSQKNVLPIYQYDSGAVHLLFLQTWHVQTKYTRFIINI